MAKYQSSAYTWMGQLKLYVKLLVLLALLLPSTLSAQVSGSIELGWAPQFRLSTYDQDMVYIPNSQTVYDNMFYIDIGLTYDISIFQVYGWTDTWMMKSDSIYFAPFYVDYGIGIQTQVLPNLFIDIEHACQHPVFTEGYDGKYLRGAYNKIGIRMEF